MDKLKALMAQSRGRHVPTEYAAEFEDARVNGAVRRLKIAALFLFLFCAVDFFMPAPPEGLVIPGAVIPSLYFAVALAHAALLVYRGGPAQPLATRRLLCRSFVFCLCAVAALSIYNAARAGAYPTEFFVAAAALAVVPGFKPRAVLAATLALYVYTVALIIAYTPFDYAATAYILQATLMPPISLAAAVMLYQSGVSLYAESSRMTLLNRSLSDIATHDELTKLHNRRAFEANFPEAIAQCRREKTPLCVMMLDVDCFKMYNDDFGHLEGDKALFRVAECFRGTFQRESDFIARYGGEEFVVVVRMDGDDAAGVAQTLLHRVASMNLPNPRSLAAPYLTVSAGLVCLVPTENDTRETILLAADEALYEAKETGRNRVVVRKS